MTLIALFRSRATISPYSCQTPVYMPSETLRWWGLAGARHLPARPSRAWPGGTPLEISSQTRSVSSFLPGQASAGPRASGDLRSRQPPCDNGNSECQSPLFVNRKSWRMAALMRQLGINKSTLMPDPTDPRCSHRTSQRHLSVGEMVRPALNE